MFRMRSYILAIALAILVAAIYTFQNTSEVLVRFLIFERTMPQGIWDALVFAAGVLMMWLFSAVASISAHSSYKSKLKEKDRTIKELEEEKASMLNVFKHLPDGSANGDHERDDVHPAVDRADEHAAEDHSNEQGSDPV